MNSEQKKELKKASRINIIWILIAVMALGGATFAWFNFNNATNVEPNTGNTVSNGEENLLISNNRNGKFDTECILDLSSNGGDLRPVSTKDMNKYYSAIAQDNNGISILYEDSTKNVNSWTVHGYLYLKVENGEKPLDIYLFKEKLNFGKSAQALASMRLGLKVNDKNPVIMKLDDMGNTSSAAKRQTTPSVNTVVSSLTEGSANYVTDASNNISDYSAKTSGINDTAPKAGKMKLCRIPNGKVAKVEYCLYLEGCDINTINDVQNKDVKLKLSFAGVPSGN